MSFTNKEIRLTDFLENLHERVKFGGNTDAIILFEHDIQEGLVTHLQNLDPDWQGYVNAGDFDKLYPIAVDMLREVAGRMLSEAHPDIYVGAHEVSVAFCDELNELFECSGEEAFDLIPIKSFTEIMSERGLIEVKDGSVSLTPKGEEAANEVEQEIGGRTSTLLDPSLLSKGLADGTYWHRTSLIERDGNVPTCCGEKMVATDDHGRFKCFSCGREVAV